MTPKRAAVLLMYLDWARRDLTRHAPSIPAGFAKALEQYGRRKAVSFDIQNTVQLMQQVEIEGFTGDERYVETARRLGRFRGKTPDDRLIRSWWERRKEEGPNLWLDDKHFERGRGRPIKKKAISR